MYDRGDNCLFLVGFDFSHSDYELLDVFEVVMRRRFFLHSQAKLR